MKGKGSITDRQTDRKVVEYRCSAVCCDGEAYGRRMYDHPLVIELSFAALTLAYK